MPALPDIANVIKHSMHWAIEGDPLADTILHYHYTSGPPDDTDLTAYLVAMDAAVTADLAPLYQSGIQYLGSDVRDLSNDMGGRAVSSAAIAGTRTGTKLAPGSCALANYIIRRTYRGGKPRSYWPFGVSGDVATTGLWADAFVAAAQTGILDYLQTALATFGGMTIDTQCQVSYYGPPNRIITSGSTGRARTVSTRRDAPGGTGHPIVDTITNAIVSKVIGSQRRRNRNA